MEDFEGIATRIYCQPQHATKGRDDAMCASIAAALKEAYSAGVEQERERCAGIADELYEGSLSDECYRQYKSDVAAAIRHPQGQPAGGKE